MTMSIEDGAKIKCNDCGKKDGDFIKMANQQYDRHMDRYKMIKYYVCIDCFPKRADLE